MAPGKGVTLSLPPEIFAEVSAAADVRGLTKASFISAVLVGAMRTGSVDRCIEASSGIINTIAAYMYKPRVWVAVDDSIKGGKAYSWTSGPWRLTRLGETTGTKAARSAPGNGWYLEGPGIEEPLLLGSRRDQSQKDADAVIARLERETA